MIQVLVADDSVLQRRIIKSALEMEHSIDVCGTAPTGAITLKKIEQLNPDLVLMNVVFPDIDGIQLLRKIKERWPKTPVIVFSSKTSEAASITVNALTTGAADYIEKPSGARGLDENVQLVFRSLVPKIKMLCAKNEAPAPFVAPHTYKEPRKRKNVIDSIDVIAIGVSTGGPNALMQLFPSFPANLAVPIVIVQHMPPVFTSNLAKRLDKLSKIQVHEAKGGDLLKPGGAWLAPGGFHMVLEKNNGQVFVGINEDPPEEGCRPAVDVLFRSVADVYGANVLAVILTGMGKDGFAGSQCILKEGGTLFAQDEESSVIWGMPGAVTKAGLPEKVVPLDQMGYEIVSRIEKTARILTF
ncbi:MAG: chemotaxis response regulator protein-glutamate methylesterase [Rhodothermales bacterium]